MFFLKKRDRERAHNHFISFSFCIHIKEFNAQTSHLEPGLPTPVIVEIQPDRSFKFEIRTPPTSLLLKRAAGITSGSSAPGTQIAGNISLKHIYEIAKIKLRDGAGVGEEQVSFSQIFLSFSQYRIPNSSQNSDSSRADVQVSGWKCKKHGT